VFPRASGVEALDVSEFEKLYGDERASGLPTTNDAQGVALCVLLAGSSTRRLEQRVREDLAFRYLAADWRRITRR